ncbi:MAG: transglutaminase-like domain-containing protein [Spirochaetia bacterium]
MISPRNLSAQLFSFILVLFLSSCAHIRLAELEYQNTPPGGCTTIDYLFTSPESEVLTEFSHMAELDQITANTEDQLELLWVVSSWAHSLWDHHSSNQPSSTDPRVILSEVRQGVRYRCVEYARIIHAALLSMGIPARFMNMKQEHPENTSSSHVVCEAYLSDYNTWVMVDCQWNRIPMETGWPLSTAGMQRVIASQDRELSFYNHGSDWVYQGWVTPYLFYLHFNPDCRIIIDSIFARRNISPMLFDQLPRQGCVGEES